MNPDRRCTRGRRLPDIGFAGSKRAVDEAEMPAQGGVHPPSRHGHCCEHLD